MSFEVYIWIVLLMLLLTAVGAKVLTTRLLGMQKRRFVVLQAKKQGLTQRQNAVHKRLESLRNTREMMARRKDRLTDEVADLRNQAGEADDDFEMSSDLEGQEVAVDAGEGQVEVEAPEEETVDEAEVAAIDASDPDSREIKTQHDRTGSLFEEDKPREIKTYLDKIRDSQTRE